MTPDEAITALKSNSLEIDCVGMVLTQNASAEPITYEGKGYIRQTTDGALNFKIYVSKVTNNDTGRDFVRRLTPKSGSVYEDSDFYTLNTCDATGREWRAERIIPECKWAFGNCSFVQADIRSIKTEHRHYDEKQSVKLRYFDVMELPIEFGRAEFGNKKMGTRQFSAAGAEIAVEESPDETLFTATSPDPFDQSFHTRIDEAVKFLTAKSLEWRVHERQDGQQGFTELTSATRRSFITRMEPPITRNILGYWEAGWNLFTKYLEYTIRNTEHNYWNHCTSQLNNAREASANTLDAWAAGLGVAVEGMVELIPFELPEDEKKRIGLFKKWLLGQINASQEYSSFAARIQGMLAGLNQVRVKDRMMPLIGSGHITEDYMEAWSTLRNRYVHPKQVDPQHFDAGEIQKILNLINKTTMFMYEIIFYLIGYAGAHADYGTHGWPLRSYPLAMSQSEGQGSGPSQS